MNDRVLAALMGVLTVIFLVLNFLIDDAGTLFLILAVASALAAGILREAIASPSVAPTRRCEHEPTSE